METCWRHLPFIIIPISQISSSTITALIPKDGYEVMQCACSLRVCLPQTAAMPVLHVRQTFWSQHRTAQGSQGKSDFLGHWAQSRVAWRAVEREMGPTVTEPLKCSCQATRIEDTRGRHVAQGRDRASQALQQAKWVMRSKMDLVCWFPFLHIWTIQEIPKHSQNST